jgi:hypothetical protein
MAFIPIVIFMYEKRADGWTMADAMAKKAFTLFTRNDPFWMV